jgi:sugar lactone lactonase YvrE
MCSKLQTRLIIVIFVAFLGFGAQFARAEPEPGVGKVVTVYRFDPSQGQYLEGLAIDKHGNIYVGLAFIGEIWKFAPDGTLTAPFATTDVAMANGQFSGAIVGLAVDHQGNLYVCNASNVAGTHGIWKVDRDGHAALFAALDPLSHPEATPLTPYLPSQIIGNPPLEYGFPNGMAFDEAGNLYVGDSPLGLIWKITKKGEAEVWLQDQLLNVTTPDGFGANDIEFDRGFMYVSNLEQGSVVRIKMPVDHQRPIPEVFVQGPSLIGADGLAFDVSHNLYMAIDVQNTLVRITPDGTITTLATFSDGLDYPASTSFGQTPGERTVLYFTNAGLNFGTPSLQKIDVGVRGVPLP